ncbi:hypothetical protein CR513_48427, partial [Mucuna pruriens]
MSTTIQDLKMSGNLSSQTIPNPRGNASVLSLRSGRELPQTASQQRLRPTNADSEPDADSQVPQPDKFVPFPFPTRTLLARKPESDEELLKMFRKVEINIPLLDSIKQIPKYAKFLKELCVHKRKKMKEGVEFGGIVSALTRNDEITCHDLEIFSIPCTIDDCTFADAILDLGASINDMLTSIYKSLNFGDLEPTRMTIQLENRSFVQPLGVLEDVLLQVNELIFPAEFYVLDMEDETPGKGSTLILGRPFLMTARTKIDVHAGTFSMEFGDNLVQFNIFEAMKHPTEDYSLFGIDLIDELVEEHLQLDIGNTDIFNCLRFVTNEVDYDKLWELHNLSHSEDDDINDLAYLNLDSKLTDFIDQVCKHDEKPECSKGIEVKVVKTKKSLSAQKQSKVKIMMGHLVPNLNQVGQLDPKPTNDTSSSPPTPTELKPLSSHLKYTYLGNDQQFPVIIANNLHQEQEEKLLHVLRQYKKAIGWKLSDLPSINPSIDRWVGIQHSLESPPSTTIALEGRQWCTSDGQTLRFPSTEVRRLY